MGPRVPVFPKEVVCQEAVARVGGGGEEVRQGRVWQEIKTGRTHCVSIMVGEALGQALYISNCNDSLEGM